MGYREILRYKRARKTRGMDREWRGETLCTHHIYEVNWLPSWGGENSKQRNRERERENKKEKKQRWTPQTQFSQLKCLGQKQRKLMLAQAQHRHKYIYDIYLPQSTAYKHTHQIYLYQSRNTLKHLQIHSTSILLQSLTGFNITIACRLVTFEVHIPTYNISCKPLLHAKWTVTSKVLRDKINFSCEPLLS